MQEWMETMKIVAIQWSGARVDGALHKDIPQFYRLTITLMPDGSASESSYKPMYYMVTHPGMADTDQRIVYSVIDGGPRSAPGSVTVDEIVTVQEAEENLLRCMSHFLPQDIVEAA